MSGVCYLVGAGPGDPGLLTVKALDCLRRAEAVFYDHLAAEELLAEAPPQAERRYVGKRAGEHALPQEAINAELCAAVAAGRVVVRLKGGDPFVFGRGGEEAQALTEAGLRFEIVPGVTAGVAAAAYAGIPVTHRGVATAVTFVTGHEAPEKPQTQTDWAALAKLPHTLCLYMGVGNLRAISAALIAGGRDAREPAAAIRWGTTPRQATIVGTLGELAAKVEAAGLRPPALIVVGAVAALRERLQWFERRPLFGRRVVVTRARTQASRLVAKLRALGAETAELPTIRIEPVDIAVPAAARETLAGGGAPGAESLDTCDPLSAALIRQRTTPADWVVFTSVNGVERVAARLAALALDLRVFAGSRLAAIGAATAEALAATGLRADLVPPTFTGAALFAALAAGEELAGKRFLLLRADLAGAALREDLLAAGAEVVEATAYRTAAAETIPPAAARALAEGVDALTFCSSSTVRNFAALIGAGLGEINRQPRPLIASIGPITSATLRELNLAPDIEAAPHTIDGLVDALRARLG